MLSPQACQQIEGFFRWIEFDIGQGFLLHADVPPAQPTGGKDVHKLQNRIAYTNAVDYVTIKIDKYVDQSEEQSA